MMSELKQKSCISVKLDLLQQKAINFYRKNCQSIEIVKDDELQKVNFRVKNKVYNLDKYPKYYIVWCWWTPHSNDWLQFVVFSFLLFIKKTYTRSRQCMVFNCSFFIIYSSTMILIVDNYINDSMGFLIIEREFCVKRLKKCWSGTSIGLRRATRLENWWNGPRM